MTVTRIDQFMSKIGKQRGMSLTTGFDVCFDFGPKSKFPQRYYFQGDDDLVHMLCDEAQLPNVQTATGQMSGRYLGEQAVQYPHSRMFTDVGLGFLCDAQMTPFKFFQNWYNTIFGDQMPGMDGNGIEGARTSQPLRRNRVNRLKYMDEYVATGANYFVGAFQWGDLSHEQAMRSIDLFTNKVMPHYIG